MSEMKNVTFPCTVMEVHTTCYHVSSRGPFAQAAEIRIDERIIVGSTVCSHGRSRRGTHVIEDQE